MGRKRIIGIEKTNEVLDACTAPFRVIEKLVSFCSVLQPAGGKPVPLRTTE